MIRNLILLLGLIMTSVAAQAKEGSIAALFDSDSDFMRGFETGLFLRTKGGTVEEYGC